MGRRSVDVEVECGRLLRGNSERSFVGVVESGRIGVVGRADGREIMAAGAGGSSKNRVTNTILEAKINCIPYLHI